MLQLSKALWHAGLSVVITGSYQQTCEIECANISFKGVDSKVECRLFILFFSSQIGDSEQKR